LNKPHFGRADGRFPVYVILTTQHGLIKKYGADETGIIAEVLDELAIATQALPKWNAVVAYADEAENAHRLGVTPVKPNDPWAVKTYLIDLDESLRRSGQMIGAVLIVGEGDVVPFHMLPNPVDDLDDEVPSDNPYATLDEDYFIPSWPVGRMPGGAGKRSWPAHKGLGANHHCTQECEQSTILAAALCKQAAIHIPDAAQTDEQLWLQRTGMAAGFAFRIPDHRRPASAGNFTANLCR